MKDKTLGFPPFSAGQQPALTDAAPLGLRAVGIKKITNAGRTPAVKRQIQSLPTTTLLQTF